MLSFTKENVVIPKESIRYRIVANSNNDLDQYNKLKANEIIFDIKLIISRFCFLIFSPNK